MSGLLYKIDLFLLTMCRSGCRGRFGTAPRMDCNVKFMLKGQS